MTPHEFRMALEERGVLVTDSFVGGVEVRILEVVREGIEIRVPFVPEGRSVAPDVRRYICELLGLPDDMIPVSIRDITDRD